MSRGGMWLPDETSGQVSEAWRWKRTMEKGAGQGNTEVGRWKELQVMDRGFRWTGAEEVLHYWKETIKSLCILCFSSCIISDDHRLLQFQFHCSFSLLSLRPALLANSTCRAATVKKTKKNKTPGPGWSGLVGQQSDIKFDNMKSKCRWGRERRSWVACYSKSNVKRVGWSGSDKRESGQAERLKLFLKKKKKGSTNVLLEVVWSDEKDAVWGERRCDCKKPRGVL